MKRFFVLLTVCLVIVLSACSKKVTDTTQETDSNTAAKASSKSVEDEAPQEIGEERAQEIAFSWFKKNDFSFQSDKEDKYSFQFTDNHEDIYGEESYLLIMFFEGSAQMHFAVTMQKGKLYLDYGVNNFVPIDNIKVLDDTKEESEPRVLIEKSEKNSDERELAYFETIQREYEKYFVYGKFKSATLKSIFVMNVMTEEVFEWELDKDIFKKTEENSYIIRRATNKWFDNTEIVAYKGDFTTSVERTDTLDCNIKNLYIGASSKGTLYQMQLDVPDVANVSEELLNIGFFYFEKDRIYRMLELSQEEQSKLLTDGIIPDSATIVCQDEEIKDKNSNKKGWHERIDRNEDVVEYYRWNDENTTNFYEHIFWEENVGIILYRRGYAAELDSITMWREEYVSNPHE